MLETIDQYNAKGWGDPAGQHTARTNLQTADTSLEEGNYDDAHGRFSAAMDYLTSMAKAAGDDLMARLKT